MKNKSIKSKIIAGVLMASIMTSATTVFAADTTDTNNNATIGGDHKDMFKTVLDGLVTAGTITSTQETAIETALAPQGGNSQDMFTTALASLITAGTITSDEQTAITTALSSAKGDFKTALADLVTAGTITSTQETAIETALADLVTAGTITSDEQTSITTALASAKGDFKTALAPQGGNSQGGNPQDMFTTKLADLVTAGTITSAEQTAITTALASAQGDFKTAIETVLAK